MKCINVSMRLSGYLAMQPEVTHQAAGETSSKKRKVDNMFDGSLSALPCLQQLAKAEWTAAYETLHSSTGSSSASTSGTSADALWGCEEDMVFDALACREAERSAVSAASGSKLEDIGVRVRSADAGREGERADAAQVVSRNNLAIAFCRRRDARSTFRASYRLRSATIVGILTRAWTR